MRLRGMPSLPWAARAAGLLLVAACAVPSPGHAGTAIRPQSMPTRSEPGSGCPSQRPLTGGRAVSIDYVDFVFHAGGSFLNTALTGGASTRPLAAADVGPVVFTVACDFSELTAGGRVGPPALSVDSSGLLPAGTPVHAVRGYSPACRLTAQRDGQWIAYLAQAEVNHVTTTKACALTREH